MWFEQWVWEDIGSDKDWMMRQERLAGTTSHLELTNRKMSPCLSPIFCSLKKPGESPTLILSEKNEHPSKGSGYNVPCRESEPLIIC